MRLTKIDAALRQLSAAIRMLFNDEDRVAVYSLAAASCQILRDISESRRSSNVNEFSALVGKLQAEPSDAAKPLLSKRVERFYADHEKPSGITLSNMHVDSMLAGWKGKDFWKEFNASYNFLKHGKEEMEELDNFDLEWPEHVIFLCCRLCDEMRMPLSMEIKVFHDWKLASIGRRQQARFFALPDMVEQQSRTEQMQWCRMQLYPTAIPSTVLGKSSSNLQQRNEAG